MHYIQKHILDELRTVEVMRYAQLNRDEIESGHFRYHVTQLIKDGYIAQVSRGLYRLTVSGQHYVDKLSGQRVNAMPMPKVITYTLLKDADLIVLQEKQKQPYLGLLNMIGGKVHEGETSAQATIREVQEKTGNTIEIPKLAGVFEIIISNAEAVLTHAVAYVYIANVQASDYSLPYLQTVNISEIQSTADLAPDLLPILQKILPATQVQIETIQIQV